MKKVLLLAAVASLLLWSCGKEEMDLVQNQHDIEDTRGGVYDNGAGVETVTQPAGDPVLKMRLRDLNEPSWRPEPTRLYSGNSYSFSLDNFDHYYNQSDYVAIMWICNGVLQPFDHYDGNMEQIKGYVRLGVGLNTVEAHIMARRYDGNYCKAKVTKTYWAEWGDFGWF